MLARGGLTSRAAKTGKQLCKAIMDGRCVGLTKKCFGAAAGLGYSGLRRPNVQVAVAQPRPDPISLVALLRGYERAKSASSQAQAVTVYEATYAATGFRTSQVSRELHALSNNLSNGLADLKTDLADLKAEVKREFEVVRNWLILLTVGLFLLHCL